MGAKQGKGAVGFSIWELSQQTRMALDGGRGYEIPFFSRLNFLLAKKTERASKEPCHILLFLLSANARLYNF